MITEASKLTTESTEESEHLPIKSPKENNPPLSTKHTNRPIRLMPKEAPLSPAGAVQNVAPVKNTNVTASKGKIPAQVLQSKPQMVNMSKPGTAGGATKPFTPYNVAPVKGEPLKLKTTAAAVEAIKRNITPTRKLK